jgi:hypothetical protein
MTNTDAGNSEFNQIVGEINASLPLRKIASMIDRTDLSADTKALLMDLAKLTVTVGTTVVSIGRKILTLAFDIVAAFPNSTFGVVVAVIVSMLIASVPFVGAVLAPLIGPLLLALGLTMGAIADLRTRAWTARIQSLETQLSNLKA